MHPSLIASLAFGSIVQWRKNDKISPLEDNDKGMYIILSGRLGIKGPHKKVMTHLTNGDVVGSAIGLGAVGRSIKVVVSSQDVYALHLNQNEMKRVFNLFPSFYVTVCQKAKKLEAIFPKN